MNNKCKHFKIRSKQYKKYFYCSATKKEICLSDCKSCIFCERKPIKTNKYTNKQKIALKRTKTPLKQKSTKLAKLEKNRQSVFTKDLTKCIECGKQKHDLHECIPGTNRLNSIRHDLCIPLCRSCHEDKEVLLKWLFKAQRYFIKKYGYDEFIRIFKQDFIFKHKKRTSHE